MKIEKISDNQIRCLLTSEDLAQRQLKLSELAYGTEKARGLFGELMKEASRQCGFEANDYPLMIEAIPLTGGSIVLIITKVENPDELDTRFSNFAPSVHRDTAQEQNAPAASPLDHLLSALRSALSEEDRETYKEKLQERRDFMLTSRMYSFDSLADAIEAVKVVGNAFSGQSSLYRDDETGRCYLLLRAGEPEDLGAMQSVFISLTEYGHAEKLSPARQQFLAGHCTVLCPSGAVEILQSLG